MKHIDLLISAKWILPIAPDNTVLTDHALAIDQGQLIDLLPTSSASSRYQPRQQWDLTEHILMPGLVNSHAHTPMNLLRGLADDLSLADWLQQHIWPAEAALMDEAAIYTGSQLAIAEMLRFGTTCFADHYFFPQATAQAAMDMGMRACIGLPMINVPTRWAKDDAAGLNNSLAVLRAATPNPLISWAWAPHAPYTVSDHTFSTLHDINQDWQLPVHIHMHETQQEITDSMSQHHCRPLERMRRLGLVDEKLVAVHLTQVDTADLECLHEHSAHAVHCPSSNLKLASGFSPTQRMIDAGINVAVGTDGAASNNDLNLFGELHLAALLAKGVSGEPGALPARQALKMATLNGAKAFGLDHQIGSLEPGKFADVIAINTAGFYNQPIYQPDSHLVYASHAIDVEHVWVAGQHLVNQGQLTGVDTNAILAKANPLIRQAKAYAH